jgi:hypothetical protein
LQAYVGRKASHGKLELSELRKNPYDNKVLWLPIETYLNDKTEEETFKQITSLSINRLNVDYTCLCKSFVMFINDKEINCAKSNTLKLFSEIATVQDFLKLGLPIKNISWPNKKTADTNKIFQPDINKSTYAFEIDLSKRKAVMKALGVNK